MNSFYFFLLVSFTMKIVPSSARFKSKPVTQRSRDYEAKVMIFHDHDLNHEIPQEEFLEPESPQWSSQPLHPGSMENSDSIVGNSQQQQFQQGVRNQGKDQRSQSGVGPQESVRVGIQGHNHMIQYNQLSEESGQMLNNHAIQPETEHHATVQEVVDHIVEGLLKRKQTLSELEEEKAKANSLALEEIHRQSYSRELQRRRAHNLLEQMRLARSERKKKQSELLHLKRQKQQERLRRPRKKRIMRS